MFFFLIFVGENLKFVELKFWGKIFGTLLLNEKKSCILLAGLPFELTKTTWVSTKNDGIPTNLKSTIWDIMYGKMAWKRIIEHVKMCHVAEHSSAQVVSFELGWDLIGSC